VPKQKAIENPALEFDFLGTTLQQYFHDDGDGIHLQKSRFGMV
jgi:hypothetical protein